MTHHKKAVNSHLVGQFATTRLSDRFHNLCAWLYVEKQHFLFTFSRNKWMGRGGFGYFLHGQKKKIQQSFNSFFEEKKNIF